MLFEDAELVVPRTPIFTLFGFIVFGEVCFHVLFQVGPYNNPDETYHFYTLPLCQPDKVKHRSMSLGEVLKGDRLAYSQFDIKFKS